MSCEKCCVRFSFLRRKVLLFNKRQLRTVFKLPKIKKLKCLYCLKKILLYHYCGEMCRHIQLCHPRLATRLRFRSLAIRRQCSKCQRGFCNQCLIVQPGAYGCPSLLRPVDKNYVCASCLVFNSQPICRSQIARLRISDLKSYLKQQSIRVAGCLEKDDLVDIVMQHASLSSAVCNCQCGVPSNPSSLDRNIPVNPQNTVNSNDNEQTDVGNAEIPNAIPTEQAEVHNATENDCESGVEIIELLSNASSSNLNRTEHIDNGPLDLSISSHAEASYSTIDLDDQLQEDHSSNNPNSEEIPQTSFCFTTVSGDAEEEQDLNRDEPVGDNNTTAPDDFDQPNEEGYENTAEGTPDDGGEPSGSIPHFSGFQDGLNYFSNKIAEMIANAARQRANGRMQNIFPDQEFFAAGMFTRPAEPMDESEPDEPDEPAETAEAVQPGPSQARDVIHIKDIHTIDKLETLSVKQMKQLLYDNRVDFSGCCEKVELVERLTRLWIDVHLSQTNPDDLNPDDLCKVCMDAKIDCVMLKCGHMATCLDCGRVQDKCPICRVYVISVLRIFRA